MSNELTVPAAQDAPFFHALTELQQRFVLALVQYGSGKGNRARCAKVAGYQGDDNTLRVCAHNQFHNPKVQAALHEIAQAHLGSFQLFAIDGIATLAEGARDEGVKLKALLALADRAGFGTVQKIDVRHEDVNKTNDQILDGMVAVVLKNPALLDKITEPRRSQVEAMIAKLKKPDTVLNTVDADFVEVDPDEELFK